MKKTIKLVKKIEQEILNDYLNDADFSTPPPGFKILAEKRNPASRMVGWKLEQVRNHFFVFEAIASGTSYFATACYTENGDSLIGIDSLYQYKHKKFASANKVD